MVEYVKCRRLIEYVGPRLHVERTLEHSISGTYQAGSMTITEIERTPLEFWDDKHETPNDLTDPMLGKYTV